MLGSGLDTRAYRLQTLPSNLHIIELDLPNIVAYKQAVIKELQVVRPDFKPVCQLIISSVDLSKPGWVETLFQCGFNKATPTLWVLEGLIMYLEEDDAHTLLRTIYSLSTPSSRIILHTVNASEIASQHDSTHNKSNPFANVDSKMKYGVDTPQNFLQKTGGTWDDIHSYEYTDMVKVCGCEGYLGDTKTNSKFTCAIVK